MIKYTQEQLSRMSDKRLNELVARRVMGWQLRRWAVMGKYYWCPKDHNNWNDVRCLDWSPTTSWLLCGEVIGVLVAMEMNIEMGTYDGGGSEYAEIDGKNICVCKAATRAICEAAVFAI